MATVIIKDQSRIGRDVVEVGLLKRTFDEYHVRFIAANDNLDTANGFDIMSIFRDVINEWYVADTSRKIKAVFKSRMEKGLSCSGSVCYGYRASKEEKGEWIIDEEAAAVVRRIFQSVLAGETIASIAKALRAEKIPIPSEHWKRAGEPVRAAKYADPYAWSATTIGYVLKRPEYMGRKVLGKTVCENYKTKSSRKTAPEEQYTFEGAIPAIVDVETWQTVQKIRETVRRAPKRQNAGQPKARTLKELAAAQKEGKALTPEESERLEAHKSRKKIAREKLVQQAATDPAAAAELAKKRAHQSQATKKSRQKMYEEAATGNPEAVERYENYLVTRRESYHRKKQEAERTA